MSLECDISGLLRPYWLSMSTKFKFPRAIQNLFVDNDFIKHVVTHREEVVVRSSNNSSWQNSDTSVAEKETQAHEANSMEGSCGEIEFWLGLSDR